MNNRIFEITNDEVLRENYAKLIKEVTEFNSNENNKDKLTICPAMAGSENAEIMIVGRAINGWCSIKQVCTDSTRSIEEQTLEMVNRCSKCNLDWVVGKNYYTKCQKNNCPYAKDKDNKDRRKKNKPFWQFAKFIVNKYFKETNKEYKEEEWQKEIIWTNLYKASYENGGNPKKFYDQQVKICDQILKREIELYQPKIIFFITEKNHKDDKEKFDFSWFVERDENIKDVDKSAFSNTYKLIREINNENNELNCQVFVTKRPEFRNFDELFKEMKSLPKDVDGQDL